MDKKKLKLFIICHKPTALPEGDCFVPLHVGRKNSKFKEEMNDYVGDDTGDNISEKNPNFCEATGIYWIWKNVHDAEYVGLCHYRRFFKAEFTDANIDSFFADGTDVIMSVKKFRPRTRFVTTLSYMQMEDYLILKGCLKKLYPEYVPSLNRYLRGYIDYPFNMVICKKELYDKYAEWMFSIFEEMGKYVKSSGYTNGKRMFAYMSELLTALFFIHNNCKIKEIPVTFDGKVLKPTFINKLVMLTGQTFIHPFTKNLPFSIDPCFKLGLKNDGFDLDCD